MYSIIAIIKREVEYPTPVYTVDIPQCSIPTSGSVPFTLVNGEYIHIIPLYNTIGRVFNCEQIARISRPHN